MRPNMNPTAKKSETIADTAELETAVDFVETIKSTGLPDAQGHSGQFGGQYVPETLMAALEQLVERALGFAAIDRVLIVSNASTAPLASLVERYLK